MGWGWQGQRRRQRAAMAVPFPSAWRRELAESWPRWHDLGILEREHLEHLVLGFLATIEVEPARGMTVDERQRLLVAAQAVLLLVGHSLADGPEAALAHLKDVRTVVIHPTTVVLGGPRPTAIPNVFTDAPAHLLGQAQLHGPVLLAWDAVERGLSEEEVGNVVLHEFAHKLDMADGRIDGTPGGADREARRRWSNAATTALATLRRRPDPVLSQYGATNPAEFFAVATEAFFGRSQDLARHKPELYEALRDLYRQDPAARQLRAWANVT